MDRKYGIDEIDSIQLPSWYKNGKYFVIFIFLFIIGAFIFGVVQIIVFTFFLLIFLYIMLTEEKKQISNKKEDSYNKLIEEERNLEQIFKSVLDKIQIPLNHT
jgi:Ca2+/Na+ antiporter